MEPEEAVKVEKEKKSKKRKREADGEDGEKPEKKKQKKEKKEKKGKKEKKDKKEKKEKKKKRKEKEKAEPVEKVEKSEDVKPEPGVEEMVKDEEQMVPVESTFKEESGVEIKDEPVEIETGMKDEFESKNIKVVQGFIAAPEKSLQEMIKEANPKKPKPPDMMKLDSVAKQLCGKMYTAYQSDARAAKAGKPALNKIRMIPEVAKMANNNFLKVPLVNNGFLSQLCEWNQFGKEVEDPDPILPNIAIRTLTLNILLGLTYKIDDEKDRVGTMQDEDNAVGAEDIKNTKFPTYIKIYAQHESETASNRRKAQILYDKYNRLLFSTPKDYKQLTSETSRFAKPSEEKISPAEWQDPLSLLPPSENSKENEERKTRYERKIGYPVPKPQDFHHRPVTPVDPKELARKKKEMDKIQGKQREAGGTGRTRILKVVKEKGKSRVLTRASPMSIEGSFSTHPSGEW